MSSFFCEHCKAPIVDGTDGYNTECQHYPLDHNPVAVSDRTTPIDRVGWARRPRRNPTNGAEMLGYAENR